MAFVAGLGTLRGRWALMAAMSAIAVMMIFGGGIPGILATVLIAVTAIPLLGCLAFAGDRSRLRAQPWPIHLGLVGIALLPLLQIIPLPPSLWQALPGQELRIRTLALAGLADSWQPLSVTPLFTAGTAVIAIAFVALVMLLLTLSMVDLRRIAWLILGLVGLNIVIGLIQVSTGGQALLLYTASDQGAFLGFQANKNHASLVLAASLPVAAYLLGSRAHPKGTRTWLGLYAGIVIVALVTTNSRAGIGLGAVTLLLLGSLYIRSIRPAYVIVGIAVILVAAVLISTSSAFETVFSRFGNVNQDLRWQFLRTSRPIIERYWLFGSGIGSFSTLYAVNESLAWVKPTYVNQLHNEYPQLLLETGLTGILILLALVAGCVWRGIRLWSGDRAGRLPLVYGGLILLLFAIHSAVDYPLRRPALLPILALALVMAMRGDLRASTGLGRRKLRP